MDPEVPEHFEKLEWFGSNSSDASDDNDYDVLNNLVLEDLKVSETNEVAVSFHSTFETPNQSTRQKVFVGEKAIENIPKDTQQNRFPMAEMPSNEQMKIEKQRKLEKKRRNVCIFNFEYAIFHSLSQ